MKSAPGADAVLWLGHATVLIELDGVRFLTDPVLRERVGPLRRRVAPIDPAATERIDGVLLSHLHADHADLASLRSLGDAVPVVAPAGAAPWLHRNGVADVRELAPGASLSLGGLRVTATEATHDRRRRPLGHVGGAVGYLVAGHRTVYFAGDTDLFDGMAELGPVDVALLPVAGWGRTLGPGHLDARRAATAAATIAPALAIPIHWGTLAPPWPAAPRGDPAGPAREFAALVADAAPAVDVRVLAPGERVVLGGAPGGSVTSFQ